MLELKKLEDLLAQRKISRREFMARVSALGLATIISPALLSNLAHASVPKKGGRLRIGASGSTTDSLDIASFPEIMPQLLNQQIRCNLVEVNQKMQPIPELAESWDPTPDAKKWTFKLRKGVEFHNGKTMDAEDVIYTLNYHRRPDSKSAIKGWISAIEDIKADGKYSVVMTLKEGNADFPFLLSDYHLGIVPADTKGSEFNKGIGAGPFILQSYEPGVRSLVKRNANYFKKGLPYFDEVEIIAINDIIARVTALKTAKIDVTSRCDVKTFHFLEKTPGLQTLSLSGTMHYTMPMRTDTAPYNNNDVRLALKYALDRAQLLKLVLRGYGYVGNDHPIAKANRYYAHELQQREYDPDKAKYHLKKAGMMNQTFNLHAAEAAFSGAVDSAVLFKEHAAKAGININVVREPDDGYWSDVWMKKPWSFCYWQGRPTEDWFLSTVYAENANWNDAYWKHERFNKLLIEARSELDEKKRREMYVEMQRIIRDEGGTVIPLFANQLIAATDKLGHGEVAPNWLFDGFRIAERWWFK